MRASGIAGVTLLVLGVAGCVPPPQAVYAPPLVAAGPATPLVAVPGPGKTGAAFQGDDQACRAETEQLPGRPGVQPTPAQLRAAQAGAADPNVPPLPPDALPPGAAYLRCMTSRGNQVVQLQGQAYPAYGYLPAYPVYAGVGFGYPFFYDDVFLLRFYGGYGYRGYGFGRFGYGRFGYGGYRYPGSYRYSAGYYGSRFGGYRGGGFYRGGGRGFGRR